MRACVHDSIVSDDWTPSTQADARRILARRVRVLAVAVSMPFFTSVTRHTRHTQMQIVSVPGDGNCLYHALLFALHNMGLAHDHRSYPSLKSAIMDHMWNNRGREGAFVESAGAFKPDGRRDVAFAHMTLQQMLQSDGRNVDEYFQVTKPPLLQLHLTRACCDDCCCR